MNDATTITGRIMEAAKSPAFPVPRETRQAESGMTLRDYFAAAALTGITANPTTEKDVGDDVLAEVAFGLADAMLYERERAREGGAA